jgi:phospholipase/carboxylesterase
MAHGTWDSTVPMDLASLSRQQLEARGYGVEWHDYPMAHAVSPEEIEDIRSWLLRVLPGGNE